MYSYQEQDGLPLKRGTNIAFLQHTGGLQKGVSLLPKGGGLKSVHIPLWMKKEIDDEEDKKKRDIGEGSPVSPLSPITPRKKSYEFVPKTVLDSKVLAPTVKMPKKQAKSNSNPIVAKPRRKIVNKPLAIQNLDSQFEGANRVLRSDRPHTPATIQIGSFISKTARSAQKMFSSLTK